MNRPAHSNNFLNTPMRSCVGFAIRWVLCLFVFLMGGLTANATLHQDAWQKGNHFYQEKQYDSAAYYFEQIASAKPADATPFYNLGNTYYRLNKVGLAVLNYERALKRRPSYKEASDNLLLAQSRIPGNVHSKQEDIFFMRWWKAITAPQLIMVWSVLSLLFFISLIGLLLYRRLKKDQVNIRPQMIGAITLLWLLALLLAFSSAYAVLSDVKGVVVAGNAMLMPDNGKSKTAVNVPEGITLKMRDKKGNRYEVELPDGTIGLIQEDAVQLVD